MFFFSSQQQVSYAVWSIKIQHTCNYLQIIDLFYHFLSRWVGSESPYAVVVKLVYELFYISGIYIRVLQISHQKIRFRDLWYVNSNLHWNFVRWCRCHEIWKRVPIWYSSEWDSEKPHRRKIGIQRCPSNHLQNLGGRDSDGTLGHRWGACVTAD